MIASDDAAESPNTSSLIEILIKTVDDHSFGLDRVSTDMRVSELKQLVQNISSVQAHRQRLIYRGHVLDDTHTISSYSVESGHTIHMVARPEQRAPAGASIQDTGDAVWRTPSGAPYTRPAGVGRGPSGAPSTTLVIRNGLVEEHGRSVFSMRALNGAQTPLSLLNPLLTLPGLGHGSSIANELTVASSLEHIRQGILTMNTIMTTMVDNAPSSSYHTRHSQDTSTEHESKDDSESDYKCARIDEGKDGERRFFVGQWVDAKDTVNQWLAATVMDLDQTSRKLFVHFNGWPQRWDEWIDWNSPRISPFRSYTSQEASSPLLSPSLSGRELPVSNTGSDDVRLLLPEVSSLLRAFAPMLQTLSDLSASSVSPSHARQATSTHTTMPWMTHMGHADGVALDRQTEEALRHTAAELCPILDRFGRLLTDLSPHLRVLANSPIPTEFAPVSGPSTPPDVPSLSRSVNQADIDGYRRIITTPNRSGITGAPIGGHLDIHIHAILSGPYVRQETPQIRTPMETSGAEGADDNSDDLPSLNSSDSESLSEFESVD